MDIYQQPCIAYIQTSISGQWPLATQREAAIDTLNHPHVKSLKSHVKHLNRLHVKSLESHVRTLNHPHVKCKLIL